MRTEVEGLDIDALEKLAEKLTDHHHLMQRDGFAALHATATQAAAALRAQAERAGELEGALRRFLNVASGVPVPSNMRDVYLSAREDAARALLPATQAEGEK